MNWEPYDPTWLVELARQQYPWKRWLHKALAKCTRGQVENAAYIHFVSPERPNQPGSEWQFDHNLLLHSDAEGLVVLDILDGKRVGGVEIINRIETTP